jgi:1-acyl-sn-glycerol-3-phosphate acyltransferase
MIINNDSYDTPPERKRLLIDKLFLGSRYYFYLRYFAILLNARKKVKQGVFDINEYCKVSDVTFKLIEDCGGKMHFRGLDNVNKIDGPVLYIANHMSILETFILPGLIIPHKEVSFIAKQSLLDHKFFGGIMKATNPIAVTRTDPKKDYKTVMSEGKKLLESGRSIIVFPQSTRGTFVRKEFGSIGDKLAQRANVPIVPVALKTDFWGNGKTLKDFGPIHRDRKICIEFGEPLGIDLDVKKRHAMIADFIESRLKMWNSK